MRLSAVVLMSVALLLPAHSRSGSQPAPLHSLPPESCVPPALAKHELLAAASDDGILNWSSNVEEALALGRARNQEVLVYLRKSGCEQCLEVQADILGDSYIQRRLQAFILVRLDADDLPGTANLPDVRTVPAFVRLSPNGGIISKHEGFVQKDGFLAFLRDKKSAALASNETNDSV